MKNSTDIAKFATFVKPVRIAKTTGKRDERQTLLLKGYTKANGEVKDRVIYSSFKKTQAESNKIGYATFMDAEKKSMRKFDLTRAEDIVILA